MIKATDDELILVFGLIQNPVMIPDLTDFQEHEMSRIAFAIIQYLKEIDLEKWIDTGNCIMTFINLKRRKVITASEFEELYNLFGDYSTAHCYILNAYQNIKENSIKNKLAINLSSIDLEDDISDIYSQVKSGLDSINLEADEYVESMEDIEPRSNKTQKSLVNFNHSKMQDNIAIDENYLVVIGARPGVGKTTFAVKLALENSKGSKVLFYSLELTKEQITRKAKYYGGYYHKSNVLVKHSSRVAINDIRKDVKKSQPKFVIIDQLNKVEAEGKTELDRLTNAIRSLKILATELKTPMIVLHQINRSAVDSEKPMIQHLKGSGAVEEESDVILLLSIGKGFITTVYCDKNRSLNGNTYKADFKFDPQKNLYKEI